jgi:hypothetical protein
MENSATATGVVTVAVASWFCFQLLFSKRLGTPLFLLGDYKSIRWFGKKFFWTRLKRVPNRKDTSGSTRCLGETATAFSWLVRDSGTN